MLEQSPASEDRIAAADASLHVDVRRRILRGAASNAAGQAVSLVTGFLLTPYILHRVGSAGFGLWVLVGSVIAYGALLDLGIGSAVIKFLAEYWTRRDAPRARVLLATVLRLYLALGVVVVALSMVLAWVLPDLLRIDPEQRHDARILVLLMGFNLAISIASAPAASVLAALHRFDLYNIVATAGGLLGAAATIAALAAGWGLIGMVAIGIPINLAGRALSIHFIRRVAPDLPLGYAGASAAMARKVVGFSSAVFATHISEILQKKTDEIVIAAVLAVSSVTPYALGRRLSEVAHLVTDQLLRVLLPVAAELHAAGDREQVRALYVVSTRLTIAIFLAIAVPIFLLPREILTVWVGPKYSEAGPIIVILVVASFLLTSQWPAGSVLQGIARFGPIAFTSLASGLANVILSIALARRMGIIGVAIGTLVPTAVETMGFVLPYTMWVLAVRPGRALRQIWLPGLAPALPAAAVVVLVRALARPESLAAVAGVAAIGSLTYTLCYLSLPATAAERQTIRDAARRGGAALEWSRARRRRDT